MRNQAYLTKGVTFVVRDWREEEPDSLVHGGPYRFSRNPMYLGVLLVVFGQAAILASPRVAVYGACWLVSSKVTGAAWSRYVSFACFTNPSRARSASER